MIAAAALALAGCSSNPNAPLPALCANAVAQDDARYGAHDSTADVMIDGQATIDNFQIDYSNGPAFLFNWITGSCVVTAD